MFVYIGTSRSNSTGSIIENDLNFVKGAPLVLSTNDDLVIVFKRTGKEVPASFTISA